MSVYYNKKLISGVREVPQMTLAEYNALTNKPDLWLRTDAPESDRGISASDVEYSTGVSVEDKIDSINAKIQRTQKTSTQTLSFSNIPSTCTGFLQTRAFNGSSESQWVLTPFNIYNGTVAIDTPLIVGNDTKYPVSATYSNGTITFTMSVSNGSYFATLYYGA